MLYFYPPGRYVEGIYYSDNTVEYNLIGHTTTLGLRTEKVGNLFGNKNIRLDLNIGYEEDDSLSYYNAKYEPAGFKRDSGIIIGSSFILLY